MSLDLTLALRVRFLVSKASIIAVHAWSAMRRDAVCVAESRARLLPVQLVAGPVSPVAPPFLMLLTGIRTMSTRRTISRVQSMVSRIQSPSLEPA